MQAIHGNPHHLAQMVGGARPLPPAAPGGGQSGNMETTGPGTVDQVDLSPAAKQFLHGAGPGKSAQSPAHQARAAIAENASLYEMPFGKVVSAINHGTLDALLPAQEPVEPASTGSLDPITETVAVEDPPDSGGGTITETATETVTQTVTETSAAQRVLQPATDEVAVEELVTNQEEPVPADPTEATDPVEPVADAAIQTLDAPVKSIETDTEISILDLLTNTEDDAEDEQPAG